MEHVNADIIGGSLNSLNSLKVSENFQNSLSFLTASENSCENIYVVMVKGGGFVISQILKQYFKKNFTTTVMVMKTMTATTSNTN